MKFGLRLFLRRDTQYRAVPYRTVQDSICPHNQAMRLSLRHLPPFNKNLMGLARSTRTLLVGVSGAGLTSLARHPTGNYVGAFFLITRSPQQRLTPMGGATNRALTTTLQNPFGLKLDILVGISRIRGTHCHNCTTRLRHSRRAPYSLLHGPERQHYPLNG